MASEKFNTAWSEYNRAFKAATIAGMIAYQDACDAIWQAHQTEYDSGVFAPYDAAIGAARVSIHTSREATIDAARAIRHATLGTR